MTKPDLNALFEDGMQRGKNTAVQLKVAPAIAPEQDIDAPELAVDEDKSNIQILFELACENASDKVFNICDWENSERLLQGFMLETTDDQYDANGQKFWPSIEVTVNPDSNGDTFKVTLEGEEKDPKIAEAVSMSDTAEMVAFYIGMNQP